VGARDTFASPQARATDGTREYSFAAADFERVRQLIHARAGISLNDSKQNMVYSRLARRLRALGIAHFADYLQRLEVDAEFIASESQEFINALTTNLTSFYRETHHFPILAEFLGTRTGGAPLRVWCAAASTGEEPYTIAITLIETLGVATTARLLATDIDTRVLATAEAGIYKTDGTSGCGDARLRRFFLRGKGENEGKVRVRPELADVVQFATVNLLHEDWPAVRNFAPQLDVVFCRNVMIYFDKPTQHKVLARIARALAPGGLLFVGHSENFTDCRDTFELRGKTVYQRRP